MINNFFNKFVTNEFFFCFIIFLSIYIKFYRTILYIRILLEYLPLYNGYKWPISLIYFLTNPISRFYGACLPEIYLPIIPIDPAFYLTIEFCNVLIEVIYDIQDAFAESIFL